MSQLPAPFDYLATCSEPSLESFELSRFNRIANLRKELRQILNEWIEAEVEARLARWLLNQRRLDAPGDPQAELSFPERTDTLPFHAPKHLPAIGDNSLASLPVSPPRHLIHSAPLKARCDLHGV